MKQFTIALAVMISAATACLQAADWHPKLQKESEFTGRKLETFQHASKEEWGYETPQRDTFLLLHPQQPNAQQTNPQSTKSNAPLYVVLHSAGHDVHSCLACTTTVGNHDIYHAPQGFFALYLDCRANKGDWWWGSNRYKTPEASPTDKRVMDTVKWVMEQYEIDENRVYLCGNSMGGSGTLGIGMRHGDVFAAIKANVPAGVEHVSNRMYFSPHTVPPDVKLPDPPIVIDYSAQNDGWSKGHDEFFEAMTQRRYPLLMYWGPFGHANNHEQILKVNDLINSFDWLSVKKNEAYPVFTNASINDALPWPNKLDSDSAGQVNAFFRWKTERDVADGLDMTLYLTKPTELETRFTIPTAATADVSLRRLQRLRIAPLGTVRWEFGAANGSAQADATGCVTIPRLKITATPVTLRIAPEPGTEKNEKAEGNVTVLRNISYLGEDRAEKLDLYLPQRKTDGKRPAIVIVHGGGWHGGDKAASREQNIANNLARAGYVCASINYRLCAKDDSIATRLREIWPGNLHDCKTAVRYLRMKANDYAIDKDRIGAIGGSAGGHLVAMMAVTDAEDQLDPQGPYGEFSCRIQAVVPLYGVHDLLTHAQMKGESLGQADVELCRQASPITWITADDPPTLILHGTKDALVPVKQSEILRDHLTAAKISCQLIVIEGAPHSFHLEPKQRDLRSVVIGFFDEHLKR
jgi:acetyl esterase/lipase